MPKPHPDERGFFAAVSEGSTLRSERDASGSSFRRDRLEQLEQIESWHFWFVPRRELVERLLRRHVEGQAKLAVDVGCGNGAMLPLLSALAQRVLGLDRRPEGLCRLARNLPRAWRVQCEAEHLSIDTGKADTVIGLDVLEHADDSAVLAEIHRVLRPGGVALVTVPAMPWLWSYRDEDAGHRRRYCRKELSSRIENAGLEILHINYYQCLLFPVLVVTRILGKNRPAVRDFEEGRMRLLNGVLTAINRLEARLGVLLRWPFGSSLVAVCRKPAR